MVLNVTNDKDFYKRCCMISNEFGLRTLYHKPLDSETGYLIDTNGNRYGVANTFVKDVFIDYVLKTSETAEETQMQHHETSSYEGMLKIDPHERIDLFKNYSIMGKWAICSCASKK